MFEEFAGWFAGKESPVHLFWHSFDLAVTRFNGRAAPPMPDADPVTREAYGDELISFGFWAGDQNVPEAAYYAYVSPGAGRPARAGAARRSALGRARRELARGAPLRRRARGRRPAGRAARLPRGLLPARRRRRRVGPRGARVELVPAPRMNRHKRLTLVAAILGSAVATIDGTIVNVALPAIERDLGGGLASQQWVANAYLLALGPLILIGGSLGDIYGERRVFAIGVSAFGVLSLACALAPSIDFLIGARALQGAAGALVTPSSLAIIVAAFPAGERAAAIGAWTAWGGIAAIVGPLVGGEIVDHFSWRWIFAINIPLVAVTLGLILAAVPPTVRTEHRRVDVVGALLCVLGLGGFVFALVEQPRYGWASPTIWVPLVRRDRPSGGVPGLRVARPRADAEARALPQAQLRGREPRDARDVRRDLDPLLLPRDLPPAGGRVQRAPQRARHPAGDDRDVRALETLRRARRPPRAAVLHGLRPPRRRRRDPAAPPARDGRLVPGPTSCRRCSCSVSGSR